MRPTLLPRLLESIKHNFNHGTRDVRLFEIGRVFVASEAGELPQEREALALVATGGATEEGLAQATREIDFYDLKGALEAAVEAMKSFPLGFAAAPVKHLRTGQAARIALPDGTAIGTLGRLAEPIAAAHKFRQPIFVAELDLTELLKAAERAVQYRPLPRYPAVVRDVTLLMSRQVTLSEVLRAIGGLELGDYSRAKLVGTYEGTNVPEGKRALTLRVEYRSEERTLRDEEVEAQHGTLVAALLKEFAAKQR
jgi:phenylalanyl-tRNA synthetase beta chain